MSGAWATAGRAAQERSGEERSREESGPPPIAVDLRLVPAALAAWGAAFAGVGLPPAWGLGIAIGAGALAAVAGGLCLARRVRRAGPVALLLLTGLAALAAALSATSQSHAREISPLTAAAHESGEVQLSGRVLRAPSPLAPSPEGGARGMRVQLAVEEVDARAHHRWVDGDPAIVIAPASWRDLELGALVTFPASLRATDPGDRAYALAFTYAPPEVVAGPPAALRPVAAVRTALHGVLADRSGQARGLIPGMSVGDDRHLPADVDEAMRSVAMTHLTAISGTHLAIVIGAVLLAGVWLPPPLRVAVAALAMLGFVLLVRPEPSILRASAMASVVLAGLLLGRPSRALPALCLAVAVLMTADPQLAHAYGFILSVLATAGLVTLARPWARWLSHVMPRWLATAISVPAAAQAACGPVVLLLQPALPLYAVPANLLAAPAVPPATLLGVGTALLAPLWPGGAEVLGMAATAFTWWISWCALTFAGLPGAQLPWWGGTPGVVLLAAATAVTLVLLAALGGPRAAAMLWWPVRALRRSSRALRMAGLITVLIAAALALLPVLGRWIAGTTPGALPPDWAAHQCDVGQGSAFLMRSGPDSAVMVDVGDEGMGAARCVQDAGVQHLDLLVLSHPHRDHVGGLAEVLADVTVTEVLLSPATAPEQNVAQVAAELDAAGVPGRVTTASGEASSGHAGAVEWELLWPTDAGAAAMVPRGGAAANDLSLTVLLDDGELSVLALGDLELDGQAGLRQAWQGAGLAEPAVAIMAHHGSGLQDPALATLLSPSLTLVSVGADNTYGHPASSAIDLYTPHGPVLRTDLCGAITLLPGSAYQTERECLE